MTAVLIGTIFVGVFAVAFLLISLIGRNATEQSRQNLTLISDTVEEQKEKKHDDAVDFRKNVLLSAVPWVNRWLQRIELAPMLRRLLNQANLKWTVGGLLLMCLACSTVPAYLVYLRTGSSIIALAIGVLLGFAPIAFVLFKRMQRFAKFEQGLPEALDMMVSGLRVGQSLNAAFGMVGRECPDPIGGEFRICFDEQNYGLELRNAIDNMTTRVPIRDIRIVATAILIQKESGGNLAEVLENTASVIRSRFRLKRQVKVHTAQGRMTGWVLSLLPVVLGFAIYLMNPTMMSVLWTRPLGIKLLWAALGMWVIGTLIVQKIVRMDV